MLSRCNNDASRDIVPRMGVSTGSMTLGSSLEAGCHDAVGRARHGAGCLARRRARRVRAGALRYAVYELSFESQHGERQPAPS